MSRRKSKSTIVPWLSARPDNHEKRFIQVGDSILFSEPFRNLHMGARHLYLCMAMESAGKRDFKFPTSAARKYGIPSSSFWNYVQELKDKQFIVCRSNKNLRKPNDYSFSMGWKAAKAAAPFRRDAMATYSISDQKPDKSKAVNSHLVDRFLDNEE